MGHQSRLSVCFVKIDVQALLSMVLCILGLINCGKPQHDVQVVEKSMLPTGIENLAYLQQKINDDPKNIELKILLADQAYQLQQYDIAYEAALGAYKLNKSLPQVRWQLMRCYVVKGLYIDAEEIMNSLQSSDWPYDEWIALRSTILARTGNYKKAMEFLDIRIKKQGESVAFLLEKAALHMALKDTVACFEAVKRAYRLDTTHTLVWGKLAGLYLALDQPDSALLFSKKLVDFDSIRTDYLQLLVRSYLTVGQYKEAETYAQKLFNIDSLWYESRELLAHAYYRNKKFVYAIPLYEQCLRMKPYKKENIIRIAVSYQVTNQLDLALDYYNKIDSLDNQYNFAQQMKALIQKEKSRKQIFSKTKP